MLADVGHEVLRPLPPANARSPHPQDVLVAIQVDPDRGAHRPVTDLVVTDLDHDRVDEHRRVDLLQRPVGPGLHLLDHLVGDPADGVLGDRRPGDLLEVRADLPGRQTLGVQGQDNLIDIGQPALPLPDDHRLEYAVTRSRGPFRAENGLWLPAYAVAPWFVGPSTSRAPGAAFKGPSVLPRARELASLPSQQLLRATTFGLPR